jgi:hypothetical protein
MSKNTAPNDFVALILTHGRPDRCFTYHSLRKHGYTGPIILVVDNEDKTIQQYHDRYPGEVVVFDKLEMSKRVDECDNFTDRRATIYARNKSFDIAAEHGYRYFIELDDDYFSFDYAWKNKREYGASPIRNLDKVFRYLLAFLQSTPTHSIAIAQGGDYIGGKKNPNWQKEALTRKCMNTWVCDTHRRFWFRGRMNDDVNTYTSLGSQGLLFFTYHSLRITQPPTQSVAGGMTEIYLDSGTYVKSAYTVMQNPSFAKVFMLGGVKHKRLHHHISWDHAVPKILREQHRKE